MELNSCPLESVDGNLPLQEGLERAIESNESKIVSVNSCGDAIIAQSSIPDATLLREKLDALNANWRQICDEASTRRLIAEGQLSVEDAKSKLAEYRVT